MRFPTRFKDAIEEVRSRADIVEIVAGQVALKRAGRHYKGLCPFHNEKTPSFTVSPERQLFHCFGCGAGGSVFDFVMRLRNYSFVEALEYLAGRLGVVIDLTEGQDRAAVEREEKERRELFAINELAAAFFREQLADPIAGDEARRYLKGRGLDDLWIARLGLGLAPAGWDHLARYLMKKAVLLKQAMQVGLIAPRQPQPGQGVEYYDRFRHRLIFPIADSKGRICGFGGRLLKESADASEGAKYINSPQSPLFDKSRIFYLLPLAENAMRQERRAVVVEGYMDVIALHRAGVAHAVATMGTALTPAHGRLLSRYADRVTLLFDGDSAGQRAAARALAPMAESGLDAGVVLLPTEHDPDSFLTAFGDAALRQALEDAEPLLKFCCRRIQDEGRSSRDRAAAFEEVVRALKRVPNRFQRQLWLQEFSALTGFSAEVIAGAGVEPTAAAAGSGPVPPSAAAVAATSPGAGAEAGGEPRGEEEMLLCLAFESESVYEMLRTYEGPPLISNGLLRDLLEEQFVVHGGSKSAGDVAHVLDSIQDDALRQRLQVTLLRVGELDQAVQLQAARDCMRKILIRGFEARKRDLSLRIAEAAERQDRETLENLLREKSELLQKSPSRTNLNP